MRKILILAAIVALMASACAYAVHAEEEKDSDVTVWVEDDYEGIGAEPMDNITQESEWYGGTGSGEPDADAIEAEGGDGSGRFD